MMPAGTRGASVWLPPACRCPHLREGPAPNSRVEIRMLIPILALVGSEFVALENATVHTFEPGVAPSIATVLVENDRIAAIGTDIAIPAGAQIVDLTGMHLLPGLVDGMVNFDADHDRLYVSAGITLVRDVGNELGRITVEQTREARERNPGPWIWSAGAVLDGSPPATLNSIVMENAEQADKKLTMLLGLDSPPDYLSFLPGLPRPAWEVALEKAHAAHKQVWGTLPTGVTLAQAAAAGQDGIFHLDALLPPGKSWETVTLKDLTPSIELVAKNKIAVTPTLALWGRAIVEPKEESPQLDLMSPFYVETWKIDAAERRKLAFAGRLERGMKVIAMQKQLVKALYDRGVALIPGSATPNPWLFPGDSLLDELDLWRSAGIPIEDCIRSATTVACERMGVELRGTIRKAKYADMIAVKNDPRESIGALYKPEYVVLRGRVLSRKVLDALETELKGTQKRMREELERPIEVADPDLPDGDVVLTGHVETRAIGLRISGEKFGVVRRFDGALVYCGRVRTAGQGTSPATETTVSQVVADGRLVAFDVAMRTGARVTEIKGELAGGRMNISRKMDGLPVDNVPVLQRLALVDCGSVTSWLILGYHRNPGVHQVVFFEDYDPATGPWEVALDPDASTHYVRMLGVQEAIAKYDAFGVPTAIARGTGNGVSQTFLLESKVEDGRGLPMPAAKKALAPKAVVEPKGNGDGNGDGKRGSRAVEGGAPAPK